MLQALDERGGGSLQDRGDPPTMPGMPATGDQRVFKGLQRISRDLVADLAGMEFAAPVNVVYNPLEYAWAPHREYLRLGRSGIDALMLGMNPGPWGMAQTGVPFGEIAHVRDYLGFHETVRRPAIEHPKRPVTGFKCTRSEVSGRRFWGWACDTHPTPEAFFDRFFVWNDCPLAFMEESGRNRTPDRLPAAERAPLSAACDRALRRLVDLLEPRMVIGIGGHATRRLSACLGDAVSEDPGTDRIRLGTILHPSPASPAANRDWVGTVQRQLGELGLSPD